MNTRLKKLDCILYRGHEAVIKRVFSDTYEMYYYSYNNEPKILIAHYSFIKLCDQNTKHDEIFNFLTKEKFKFI